MEQRILVVDDEQSMRDFLAIFLRKEGYQVHTAKDGLEALAVLDRADTDVVISDVRMSNLDGMKLLRETKRRQPDVEVIVMTAYSSTQDAILAMKDGAYDYVTKPFKLDEIKLTIDKALERRRMAKENVALKQQLKKHTRIKNIIGNAPPMREIFEMISKVADTKTTILVTGESGTGKELVASAIHYNSSRAEFPFVTINCGAIPSELMESELFGHIRGAFTGAVRDKDGLMSVASHGTLMLDEVSEMPPSLQVKLLRALQERRILPVGGTQEISVDTRVIAATNRDLAEEVRIGRFRQDLYYRLNVIHLRVPALRERREDIPLLVQHFVKRAAQDIGRPPMQVSEAALMILQQYDYPGNVRELSNIVERAVTLEITDQIRPSSLPPSLLEKVAGGGTSPTGPDGWVDFSRGIQLDALLEARERELLEKALGHAGGVKKQAARLLGISFRSLRYRLAKLGIEAGGEEEEDDEA
ncbi:MAG: sigma-54-dependent Fis family transcriptional regulator [Myxococcales bacterium]|nr:MAG: sigma-54-dependent Fis family transcriptional regulator [Myxococcales bacterium]